MNGRINIYHPNAKGTGCALQISATEARKDENGAFEEGAIFLHFAQQATVGTYADGKRVFPSFDWTKKIVMRLGLFEVAEIIGVMRGYKEALADGKGLFHRTAQDSKILTFEHKIEPTPGFWIWITRKPNNGESQKTGLFLSMTEAAAIEMSLSGVMARLAFG